jgi:hypothetical protein
VLTEIWHIRNRLSLTVPILLNLVSEADAFTDGTAVYTAVPTIYHLTVELSKTELGILLPLVLEGIIENQNSDFVMQ